MTLEARKKDARAAAFARRRTAFQIGNSQVAVQRLLTLLQPHRGRAVAGYSPMRTEIDPVPAMADLGLDAVVGVPVIQGAGRPLLFHKWTLGGAMMEGPFGASVPVDGVEMVPEIVIVPLVAFDRFGNRLG